MEVCEIKFYFPHPPEDLKKKKKKSLGIDPEKNISPAAIQTEKVREMRVHTDGVLRNRRDLR